MRVQVVFFALLLLGGAFAQNTKLNVVVQIFQGFVNGLAQEVDVHEVQSCIKDSDAIFNDFQTAVVDFSKNNAGAAWNGIQALVAGLQLLPSAMQDCKQAAQEVLLAGSREGRLVVVGVHNVARAGGRIAAAVRVGNRLKATVTPTPRARPVASGSGLMGHGSSTPNTVSPTSRAR